MTKIKKIVFEDVKIIFRNFSGEESRYNVKGRRNFSIIIPKENGMVEELLDAGWNVKYLKPKEDGDEPQPFLQVSVSFDNYPPNIVMISNGKQTRLDASDVSMLDWVDIETVDLSIRPYEWDVNGVTGVKAYLKDMYVTLVDDPLAAKYMN